MQSIIDILHKNFQSDHTNSRGFPGGFLNSRRFPAVVDTLFWQYSLLLLTKYELRCEQTEFEEHISM